MTTTSDPNGGGPPSRGPGFTQALVSSGTALHGIVSRTDPAQVAAEVIRLNDAVRRAAAGRIAPCSQPGDFAALLLAGADPCNAPPGR
jgi:aspartyl-tRNA(Asn)/glutamyl-tRNA(Gln) amidotransferase subunit A